MINAIYVELLLRNQTGICKVYYIYQENSLLDISCSRIFEKDDNKEIGWWIR